MNSFKYQLMDFGKGLVILFFLMVMIYKREKGSLEYYNHGDIINYAILRGVWRGNSRTKAFMSPFKAWLTHRIP